jgi:hypothetical protein
VTFTLQPYEVLVLETQAENEAVPTPGMQRGR